MGAGRTFRKTNCTRSFRKRHWILAPYFEIVTGRIEHELLSSFVWPKTLQIIFAIGLLSAFISTADTSVMLVATVIQSECRRGVVRNFAGSLSDTGTMREQQTATGEEDITHFWRSIIVSLVVAATALASVYYRNVAEIFMGVLGALAVLGLPVLCSFSPRATKLAVFLSLSTGGLIFIGQFLFVSVYGILSPDFNDGYYLLCPLVPGIVHGGMLLGSFLLRKAFPD